MKKIIECVFIAICGTAACFAQQAVSAAGGDAAGTGGSISYTIGQVVYTTISQSEGTVSQGVQQPYQISVIQTNEDNYEISLEISAYPNPTSGYLILQARNYTTGNLTYQLYDLNGKLLEDKKMEGVETTIYMDKLMPSVYILKVTGYNKEIKTFKITKN